jgi:hypothetical protein
MLRSRPLFLDQQLRNLPRIRWEARSEVARRHQHLIIGPWGHLPEVAIGELTFGDNAKIGEAAVCKEWLSHWLKGERSGVEKWPFLGPARKREPFSVRGMVPVDRG